MLRGILRIIMASSGSCKGDNVKATLNIRLLLVCLSFLVGGGRLQAAEFTQGITVSDGGTPISNPLALSAVVGGTADTRNLTATNTGSAKHRFKLIKQPLIGAPAEVTSNNCTANLELLPDQSCTFTVVLTPRQKLKELKEHLVFTYTKFEPRKNDEDYHIDGEQKFPVTEVVTN